MPIKRVLQWRQAGMEDWIDYEEPDEDYADDFEIGIVYDYQYRVIEREESDAN